MQCMQPPLRASLLAPRRHGRQNGSRANSAHHRLLVLPLCQLITMEVRPLAVPAAVPLALRSSLARQTLPPGHHALQACLSITPSAPPAGGYRGSAPAAATAAFRLPRPHLQRQRRRYSHQPCAQQPAVAATAVPEAAAELDAAGREQWAAASALVQQRCAVDAEAADAVLLKAFGWKGQAFWRQVRRRVDDGAFSLLRTRPQSLGHRCCLFDSSPGAVLHAPPPALLPACRSVSSRRPAPHKWLLRSTSWQELAFRSRWTWVPWCPPSRRRWGCGWSSCRRMCRWGWAEGPFGVWRRRCRRGTAGGYTSACAVLQGFGS